MSKLPYTQKTLQLLRSQGYKVGVVERWQSHSFKRIDLFGIIDIIAMGNGEIVGVQSTSYVGRRKHLQKIAEEGRESFVEWTECKGRFLLITWKRQKRKRGGVAFKYVPHVDDLKCLADLLTCLYSPVDSEKSTDSSNEDVSSLD